MLKSRRIEGIPVAHNTVTVQKAGTRCQPGHHSSPH
uniref:Unidentified orf n=1 Tax=Human herpesvirus 8 TaxID=37296 RepID=Q98155_HHV8|nr:unidentified orf [Human gammaherpesvirus 8]